MVSRSFIFPSFSWSYDVALGALDHRLQVDIADDRTISAPRSYRDCMLEIFGLDLSIELIPIPMGHVSVICG